ncbi:hypothetical protein ACHAWF_003629 [Thalassiosira exigua]
MTEVANIYTRLIRCNKRNRTLFIGFFILWSFFYSAQTTILLGDVTNVTSSTKSAPHVGRKFVAIVMNTRSKKGWKSINDSSLHSLLIPSIINSITETELRLYRIELVLGYDQGDIFWEKTANRAELERGCNFATSWICVKKNKARPQQIPFNPILRATYEYKADYIVRINDDSEFVTSGWITKGTSCLTSYSPPNVGVVGPTCSQGNKRILTHDMVHRTHLDIFPDYYPDEFDNWWLDDWISHVYGENRTTKLADWKMVHHTTKHGRRYKKDESLKKHLEPTLMRGRQRIDDYLEGRHVLGTNQIASIWGPMSLHYSINN